MGVAGGEAASRLLAALRPSCDRLFASELQKSMREAAASAPAAIFEPPDDVLASIFWARGSIFERFSRFLRPPRAFACRRGVERPKSTKHWQEQRFWHFRATTPHVDNDEKSSRSLFERCLTPWTRSDFAPKRPGSVLDGQLAPKTANLGLQDDPLGAQGGELEASRRVSGTSWHVPDALRGPAIDVVTILRRFSRLRASFLRRVSGPGASIFDVFATPLRLGSLSSSCVAVK